VSGSLVRELPVAVKTEQQANETILVLQLLLCCSSFWLALPGFGGNEVRVGSGPTPTSQRLFVQTNPRPGQLSALHTRSTLPATDFTV
jgi:hypothetical protein